METLDPPFMFVPRPRFLSFREKIAFGEQFKVPVSIPTNLQARGIQGKVVYLLRTSKLIKNRMNFSSLLDRLGLLEPCLSF